MKSSSKIDAVLIVGLLLLGVSVAIYATSLVYLTGSDHGPGSFKEITTNEYTSGSMHMTSTLEL